MKKFISVFLVILMLFVVIGCESEKDTKITELESKLNELESRLNELETTTIEKKLQEKTGTEPLQLNDPIEFLNFEITIKEISIVDDNRNGEVLKFVYDYTNISEDTLIPLYTFSLAGYQEVQKAKLLSADHSPEINLRSGQKELNPGETIENAETLVAISDINLPIFIFLSEIVSSEIVSPSFVESYSMYIEDLSIYK